MVESRHPIQPLALDAHGTLRFKENKIVSHLLEVAQKHGCGLNELARMEFSQDDREQFAQLIGYSLSGYGDLSYISDDTYNAARAMVDEGITDSKDARIVALEHELFMVRSALRGPMARLFGIHPDDLNVPDAGGVKVDAPARKITSLAEFCAEGKRLGLTAAHLAEALKGRPEFADCLPDGVAVLGQSVTKGGA